jgi:hypothetical protein
MLYPCQSYVKFRKRQLHLSSVTEDTLHASRVLFGDRGLNFLHPLYSVLTKLLNRVAEPEPEPVGTVLIWGLRHRNRNCIHLGTLAPEPEPYSEYGSGFRYKEMKQKSQKN